MPNMHGNDYSDEANVSGLCGPFRFSDDELHARFGAPGESRCDDSFGMPSYVPRYPVSRNDSENALYVPWYLRKPVVARKCNFFDFLLSKRFWQQFEFALRITLLAVLLPSSLIAVGVPGFPFVSTTASISAGILAAKVTVGEGLSYLFIWIRAGCIWLPLATLGAFIHIGNDIVRWCFFYTLPLFIMAVLAENMVRRICLLLFNSCMIGLLIKPDRTAVYPSQVMMDWSIGTGLCLLATFVPYPKFSKTRAQHTLANIARTTGTALTGMSSCFWSESNVERNMAMTNVRMLTVAIDEMLCIFHIAQERSFYEFFFESSELRNVRDTKAKLFERLRSNLMGLSRVLDIVEGKPWVVDEPERSRVFGKCLRPHISHFSSVLNILTDALATAETFGKIKELDSQFAELNEATVKLQHEFTRARRMLFYENVPETLEEFVPLMTFFLFSIVNFRDTLVQFNIDVHCFEYHWKDSVKLVFLKTIGEPIKENIEFFRRLMTQWRRREIQRVIEAAKVSGAMILAVGFSFLLGIDANSFSGPNNIAFVSGNNPVEAVQASVVRLTACILGTVLGFFAGTYSTTPIEKIASLCTLIFVGTFLRNDKDYGIMAVYAMFVLVPLNSVGHTTTEDAIARLNQNTFGILIYVFISVLVLPLSPGLILRKKRINVLLKMSEVLTKLCDLFSEPLLERPIRSTSILRRLKSSGVGNNALGTGDVDDDSFCILNDVTRLNLRTDYPLMEINKILEDVEMRLKETYPFMGFAREERGLVDATYPAKACDETSYHLHRMTSLLRTMWCSWGVLRSQKAYTSDTQHILRILQPIGWDVCRSFQKFVGLLSYALRDPSTVLEAELLQVVLDLMQAAEEMHTRKNQIMLFLIRSSVEKYKKYREGRGAVNYNKYSTEPTMHNVTKPPVAANYDATHPLNVGKSQDSLNEAMMLSDSFSMPVTGEDAESFHSFTLSTRMFADEAKKLLMSFKHILEHLRKKL